MDCMNEVQSPWATSVAPYYIRHPTLINAWSIQATCLCLFVNYLQIDIVFRVLISYILLSFCVPNFWSHEHANRLKNKKSWMKHYWGFNHSCHWRAPGFSHKCGVKFEIWISFYSHHGRMPISELRIFV